ncbi:ATP-binding cassette domain-containing protein [Adlercreutzia sp. ZJ138]|uniref:ATP-binding cassette domain-containing protein n=1 Tax=Adlercreutzia sp. ZJ138 TaxID=2709405 RepID=UPI0013ED0A57|nr:ATP-binding cassette domain-containing protein [Adlercreutzia sp. ZJ138]
MPENVNTSALDIEADANAGSEDARPTMIKVDHVSMTFNKASEQLNNLKEYAIKLAKRELFFEGFKALDDVSFEVKKGDVFGIMGTNGSGKSTMLKIIAGVLEPTSGTCQINGSIAPLIELGAGFDMDLTARENIYLNGALLGYSKDFIDQHFDDIIDFAEIESFLDMPMKNYSSGMVARIAFAIATVIVPEILIVDEVLSVGDFMFQKKCEDRINELIDKHGVTVLIVSHSNDQIARLCNKAIWIEKGHTRLMGDAAMVTRVYGGLGGRTGSPEAEKRVFEALMRVGEVEVPKSAYKVITGETPASVNAKLVAETWKGKTFDTVALVCDTTHANAIVANPLAGAYGAPVLPIKTDGIPDVVERLLYEHKPKQVFVFDCGGNATAVLDRLHELPWEISVVTFGYDQGLLEFSFGVYSFGIKEHLWKNHTVALISFNCNSESFAASPFLYGSICPTILFSPGDSSVTRIVDALQYSEVEQLLSFGDDSAENAEQIAKRLTVSCEYLGSNLERDACVEICTFVCDLNSKNRSDSAPHFLFVASRSSTQWAELLSTGCCAGVYRSSLLLVDDAELDSMSESLDFVTQHFAELSKLVFSGVSMREVDSRRSLMCSAFQA